MALCLDPGDADRGHDLAMPAMPAVVLPALELDHEDLAALFLRDHLARDLRGCQRLRLHGDLAVVFDQEHLGELHGGAGLFAEPLDFDHLARGDPVLLAARRDNGFHSPQLPFLNWFAASAHQTTRATRKSSMARR